MLKLEKDKLKIWTGVCTLSAAPSFYWALTQAKADISAMLIGIVLFIFVYTDITSSEFYKKLKQKKILFKALKFAFGFRILYSAVSLISIFTLELNYKEYVNVVDGIALILSAYLMEALLGEGKVYLLFFPERKIAFLPTLMTTITQGILLSLLVLAAAAIIWCFLKIINIIYPSKAGMKI